MPTLQSRNDGGMGRSIRTGGNLPLLSERNRDSLRQAKGYQRWTTSGVNRLFSVRGATISTIQKL